MCHFLQVPHINLQDHTVNTNTVTDHANSNSNGVTVTNSVRGQGWKNEALHVPPTQQEVNPTLYEELKLGQDGAGFKRLKP